MNRTLFQLKDEFPELITEILGDSEIQVQTISPLEAPKKGGIVYVLKEKWIEQAMKSQASAVIINSQFIPKAQSFDKNKPLIISPLPELVISKISMKYFARNPLKVYADTPIHPTAEISPTAKIGSGVVVGAFALIGDHVQVGDNSYIGAQTILEEHVVIGQGSWIYPQCYVGARCLVGEECVIQAQTVLGSQGYGYSQDDSGASHPIPQNGIVILEDRVEVGAQCAIDRATLGETRIGEGTKLDNHCHIAHNCTIGKHNLLTAGFMAAGSVTIGDYCLLGGNICVSDHIKIGDHVLIAGLAGVTRHLPEAGSYGGHPAIPLKDYLKAISCLPHLPNMRKQLSQALKALAKEEC